MDLNFIEILLIIITFFLGIIVVRISFNFDINKYLESKKKDIKHKLKNTCTHVKVIEVDGNKGFQSTSISPSGTLSYYCEKCGLIKNVMDKKDEDSRMKYYMENIKEYKTQEKKFKKLLKKGGFL